MKIYTKTGDAGKTGLMGGRRVSKADPRVEAYGAVDETNAVLGVARAAFTDAPLDEILAAVQRDLFAIGARLATPADKPAAGGAGAAKSNVSVSANDVTRLERAIDELEATLPPLKRFILPGGSPAGAALHHARTVCRRAERRIIALGEQATEPEVRAYMNRLSDLLFVMARAANRRAGASEIEWSG